MLRKILGEAKWKGLPMRLNSDWFQKQQVVVEAESTASGDSSGEEDSTAAPPTAPASETATEDDEQLPEPVVFIEDFRADLARLLNKEPEQLGRIRKVDGAPPKYSLVDVVVCITGQRADNAHRALNKVLRRIDRDVTHLVSYIPLLDSTDRRVQLTPVADIQTVLRVIMQLPCRNLGELKGAICEVFARFMGGDLSLIP